MKPFDFLIVPVYRSGGTAIQAFISSHPGMVVIPKGDLDHCLEDHLEMELLESFQDLMLSNPDARVGLVQHKYIGEHEDLDGIAKRLSKIVRKDGLIMVVRNHFDAVLSGMNHRRIVQYCDYSFAKAGLFWPDKVELGRGVRSYLDMVEAAECEPRAPDEHISTEKTFVSDQALDYVRYAAIQETYERHFTRATVIDYDEILSTDNRYSMRILFEVLKADKDFHLPFFSAPVAGTPHRFLSHNRMNTFSPNLPETETVLIPSAKHEHAVFGKAIPIGSVYDGYVRELFGEKLIFVAATFEASEIEIRQIDAFLRGFYYPLWRKNYEIASRTNNGFRTKSLSNELESLVRERLAPDAARFIEMNPGLGDSWRASWENPSREAEA